jgi:hypothetical protein
VEHFQKILVLKKSPKHCHYTFYFLINTILFFLKFQYKGHLGGKVSTMAGHDHLVKLYGGRLLLVKLYGERLLLVKLYNTLLL